jgi:hypothetical protein
MATKINFTKEDLNRLNELVMKLFFSAATLPNKFGAGAINIFDLYHNTSITSLQTLHATVTDLVEKTGKMNRWTMNEYQQRKRAENERWAETLDLLIGFKLAEAERLENAAKLRKAEAELVEMEENTLTPQERLARKRAEVEALRGGTEQAPAVTDAPASPAS